VPEVEGIIKKDAGRMKTQEEPEVQGVIKKDET